MRIIKELKKSGRYEYSEPLKTHRGEYQEFRSHREKNVSIGIQKDWQGFHEIHLCLPLDDSTFEQGIAVRIYDDKISLEDVEKILEIIICSDIKVKLR